MIRLFHYLQLAVAALVTIVQQARRVTRRTPPTRISAYRLIRAHRSSCVHCGVSVGEYRKNGKRYLIKTWYGRWKNLKYYSLLHEFFATYALYRAAKRMLRSPLGNQISFSKPIRLIRNGQGFSTVYEFVEGKPLSAYALREQTYVFDSITHHLSELTKVLTPSERAAISTRGLFFYVLALPYIFSVSLLTGKLPLLPAVTAFAAGLFALPKLSHTSLVLSHRDIDPQHIIMGKKTITLVDCEHMVLTFTGYDTTLRALRFPRLFPYTCHPFFLQYVRLFNLVR